MAKKKVPIWIHSDGTFPRIRIHVETFCHTLTHGWKKEHIKDDTLAKRKANPHKSPHLCDFLERFSFFKHTLSHPKPTHDTLRVFVYEIYGERSSFEPVTTWPHPLFPTRQKKCHHAKFMKIFFALIFAPAISVPWMEPTLSWCWSWSFSGWAPPRWIISNKMVPRRWPTNDGGERGVGHKGKVALAGRSVIYDGNGERHTASINTELIGGN